MRPGFVEGESFLVGILSSGSSVVWAEEFMPDGDLRLVDSCCLNWFRSLGERCVEGDVRDGGACSCDPITDGSLNHGESQ